ncbi:MAG: hypothetical protein AAB550_04015 [Patescibacteria group bacterium]
MEDIEKTNWWAYMDEPMRDLIRESIDLLKIDNNYHDYGFVVFPAAKAFEGFLKKLFYNLEIITKQQYQGDRFRIGKALNPNLPKRYQHDWVFDKLTDYCGGTNTPLLLWEAWKQCRNMVFHYYPEHAKMTTRQEAHEKINLITESMAKALAGCRV